MKTCTKCGNIKSDSEFYSALKGKNGIMSWCKVCHLGMAKRYVEKLNAERPFMRRAQNTLNNRIKAGKIQRPGHCSKCNKECFPDGHHTNYSRPLDVVWLCKSCHKRIHVSIGSKTMSGSY